MRALMAGFQVHLAKPVKINELVATIRRLVPAPKEARVEQPDGSAAHEAPRPEASASRGDT
jgi:DNA-binding response OmpR family regulator